MTNVRFKLRRDDGTFATRNPVLSSGEPAVSGHVFKIGDGVTPWNDLPAYLDETLIGAGGADPRIGDLEDLTTDNKDNVVVAVNDTNVTVDLNALYENAKAG
jgi:hypothetical protein